MYWVYRLGTCSKRQFAGAALVGAYIVYILIYAKLNPESAQLIERDDSISRKQEVFNAL